MRETIFYKVLVLLTACIVFGTCLCKSVCTIEISSNKNKECKIYLEKNYCIIFIVSKMVSFSGAPIDGAC